MQSLVRLVHLLQPTVKLGILLAVGVSVLAFTSTPFLLPEISDHYGISRGMASMISSFQLAGFVLASWGAGRWLQPRERVFVLTLLSAASANLLSALLPTFSLLVALRFLNGFAQGLLAWYGWVQAFGDKRRMGDVAMAGPVIGVVAAPVVSTLMTAGGTRLVFVFLAAVSSAPLVLDHRSEVRELPTRLRSHGRAAPTALVLLVCLGVFTLGGSSVFIYSVVLGTENAGLSEAGIAVGFSLSALVGIPAARWKAPAQHVQPVDGGLWRVRCGHGGHRPGVAVHGCHGGLGFLLLGCDTGGVRTPGRPLPVPRRTRRRRPSHHGRRPGRRTADGRSADRRAWRGEPGNRRRKPDTDLIPGRRNDRVGDQATTQHGGGRSPTQGQQAVVT